MALKSSPGESNPLMEHIWPMFGSVFRFSHLKTAVFRFWSRARFAGLLEFSLWFSVFVNGDGFTVFLVLPRKLHPAVELNLYRPGYFQGTCYIACYPFLILEEWMTSLVLGRNEKA